MKKILIIICILFISARVQLNAQTKEEFKEIASKLIFGQSTIPLTKISLDFKKNPKLDFNARIIQFGKEQRVWHYINLEGSIKTNNGYIPLFGGGEVNANPKLALSYHIVLSKNNNNNHTIKKGFKAVKGLKDKRFHFLWLNPKYEYEYSEYTTIQNYDKDTILFVDQINSKSYHRQKISLAVNYLTTLGRDTNNFFKHTFHTNVDFGLKLNDNNASILKDVKATTYQTYYDSTSQRYRVVEDAKSVSGKSGNIITFSSFNIKTNITYIYRTTKSNYIALNINANPKLNLSNSSIIFPVGIGVYFPVLFQEKSKKDKNKASVFNLGVVFNVSNVLTENDDRKFKDRIDFGIAINFPLPI